MVHQQNGTIQDVAEIIHYHDHYHGHDYRHHTNTHSNREYQACDEVMQESDTCYRSIISMMYEGVVIQDRSTRICEWNTSAERILGFTAKDIPARLGSLPWRAVHEDGAPFPSSMFPGTVSINTGEPCSHVVMGITGPSGIRSWALVSALPLFRDGETAPYAAVSVFTNITGQRQAEEALRANESRYRAVVEDQTELICRFTPAGIMTFVNPAYCRYFHHTPEELIGKPISEDMLTDERRKAHRYLSLFSYQSLVAVSEQWTTNAKHEQRCLQWTDRAIVDMWGEVIEFQSVGRDVTDLKQAESSLHQVNEQLNMRIRDLERRNYEISTLNEMSDHLQGCLTLFDSYQIIETYAARLFAGQPGALLLVDQETAQLQPVASWGDEPMRHLVQMIPSCWLLHHQHKLECNEFELCYHSYPDKACQRLCMCIPLISQKKLFGILRLWGQPDEQLRSQEEWVQLATTVAEHMSLALANLRLREQLRFQSIHDALTGLFNRRYLEETLARDFLTAGRHNRPIGVIMLDIDHFKQINDTYGHSAGDEALRAVGTFLKHNVRGGDVVCRYGGEEFTIILPDTDLSDTLRRAEQIREGIQTLRITHNQRELRRITFSLGVATFPECGDTVQEVLQMADQALYIAKATGRNRVVSSGQMQELQAQSIGQS